MTTSIHGDQSIEAWRMADTTMPAVYTRASDSAGFPQDIESIATGLAVFAHRLRIEIWCNLIPYGTSGLTAGAIATRLQIAPSSLSFHLSHMAKAGALQLRHDGRHTIYSVNTEMLSALCVFLANTIGHDL